MFSIHRLFYIVFRPRHLLIHESFTTREVSFEYNAEELGYALTLLANLEESGTGIRHEVGLAAFGTAINDSAAPTYINLIFALSLMGDMSTNKARISDNAQQQSASNDVLILFLYFRFVYFFPVKQPLEIFLWRKYLL